MEFWTKFKEFVQNKGKNVRLRKAYPQQWYDISFGNSDAHITLTVNSQSNQITCEIYIPDSKDLFNVLKSHKEKIEKDLSEKLHWFELPEKKASRIKLITLGDISRLEEWE